MCRSQIIVVTSLCLLSACGGLPHGIAQSGGATGTGGNTDGAGGFSEGAGGTLSGAGGATEGTGGTRLATGGATNAGGGSTVTTSTAPIVITSAQDGYWRQATVTEVTSAGADVTVNDASQAQTWEGFGGAFTELGWKYLSELSQVDRDQAIQLLFGPEGARFSWGRLPIGGNDFVLTRHTLDDTGEDVIPDASESNRPPPDLSLSKFSIAWDEQHLIPFIKAAQMVKPDLRFWAVPWTPPVWMKTGYTKDDGNGSAPARPSYYDGGSMKDDEATLQAHAQYFVKYIRAYGEMGINVELVAPQNEPIGEHTYPSCAWNKTVYTNFIGKHLGPALSAAGLNTKIVLGGSFDDAKDSDFVNAVLADTAARSYCALAGLGYDMVTVSKTAALKAAGMRLWVSEHKAGNYPWETATYKPNAPNDFAYALETWGLIRDAISKVGVTAYNAWHMVLDKGGKNVDLTNEWAQNSLLVADEGKLTPTPAYYVFRHLSRYVDPGAKVVATSGGDAVAFKNPNASLVVVLYNSGVAKAMTVAVGGKKLQFSAPSKGFVTLVQP